MKVLRLFSLLALLTLFAAPLTAALAQTGSKTETFTSTDGKLSLAYPTGWAAEELPQNMLFPGVMVANSKEALAVLASSGSEDNLASGQVGIIVMILPSDLVPLMGIKLPDQPTLIDLAQGLSDFFLKTSSSSSESTPTPEPPKLGKPEEIDLAQDLKAGYVTVSSSHSDGAFIVHMVGDKLLALTMIGAFPGEFTDDQAALGKAVAASVTYSGSANDLMLAITQGLVGSSSATPVPTTPTPAGTPSTSSTLDGKALVDERCTVCHDRGRIDRRMTAGTSLADWTQIVDAMISYGAQLDAQERQAVLDYLSAGQ